MKSDKLVSEQMKGLGDSKVEPLNHNCALKQGINLVSVWPIILYETGRTAPSPPGQLKVTAFS